LKLLVLSAVRKKGEQKMVAVPIYSQNTGKRSKNMNIGKHIVTWFVIAILLSCSNIVMAEKDKDINSAITDMMEKIKDKKEAKDLSESQLKNADANVVLSILEFYEKSPLDISKIMAYRQEFRLANLQPLKEVRREVARRFVREYIDPNSDIKASIYGYLSKFAAEDYDTQAKSLIRQNLGKNTRGGEMIKLIGIADIVEEQSYLEKLLIDEMAYQVEADKKSERKWCYTSGWRSRLALSRMGNKEDINKCITLIEREIDDTNDFRLLDDLGYIRQPEAIESLKKYFMSDLKLSPTNPGMAGEPFSNYLMPILDDNLKNFPVKKGETEKGARYYTYEEIELCRKWMSEQKEWKIIR
jgi:cell division protein FtsL